MPRRRRSSNQNQSDQQGSAVQPVEEKREGHPTRRRPARQKNVRGSGNQDGSRQAGASQEATHQNGASRNDRPQMGEQKSNQNENRGSRPSRRRGGRRGKPRSPNATANPQDSQSSPQTEPRKEPRSSQSNRQNGRRNNQNSARSASARKEPDRHDSSRSASPSRNQNNRQYNRRRDRSDYNFSRPAPTVPIRTNKGIKARSQRGTFSKNWWARQWIDAMERLVDSARLQRGRSYARQGQVLSIQETELGIEARVQGSRPQPYKVSIQVTPLTDEQWEQVIDALSEQALFTAQLLAGEMPENIEEAFTTAGVSLFPIQPGDLYSSCSCPDWANPCKHVAATHYILGDRFDDDPFLLFRMRGRSQEEILSALRARRTNGAAEEPVEATEIVEETDEPLEDQLDHFWEPVESLDSFPLTIRPPAVDMPLLKRLGEPAFLTGVALQDLLKPVYDTFTRSALKAAYSEEEPIESYNGQE